MFHSIEHYLIEREDCLFGGYDINADNFLNEKDGKRVEAKLERGMKLIEEFHAGTAQKWGYKSI